MAIRCRQCNGRGIEDCPNPKCKGGKVEVIPAIDLGFAHQWKDCEICRGTGKIPCRNHCDHGWIR